MPILFGLTLLVQILFAVHVVRTGRQLYWIFIIMVAPVLGCAVYFFAVVMPDIAASRAARRTAGEVSRMIDPDRELRRLTDALEVVDTIDNRRALAEEYVRRGDFAAAVPLYRRSLQGMHEHDPALMLGLARALFGSGDFAAARQALDDLREHNPRFESAEGHLLYARSLEGEGRTREALSEYAAVAQYYAGEEARCRYALLLQMTGDTDRARELFRAIVRSGERGPKHYQRFQREWLEVARRNLA
jgi:hypothetical protein